MKEIEINIKRKTKVTKKLESLINVFGLPDKKKEITYEQPYIEISFKVNEPISNEEKKQIMDLFMEKFMEKINQSKK